jgi:hypothetical protein
MISGGYTNYGQEIGILMLDTLFPRITGDIGNANTFPFPVKYKVIREALPTRVVEEQDGRLLEGFIQGARELAAEGVKAITTSCGFLALYQKELAAAVSVPVFTSSLLLVPMVEALVAPRNIVIVTANRERLSPRHLAGAGVTGDRHVIVGLEERPEFYSTFVRQKATLDVALMEQELAEAAKDIKRRYPEAGALVLECTNLPPFRELFRQLTGLPVFDIVSLVHMIQAAVAGNPSAQPGGR